MPEAGTGAGQAEDEAQRLDKWLWYARLVKTRTLAAKFVESGKVRVNRTRVTKPSRPVRRGDIITTTLNRRLRVVRILAPGERRGPAAEAAMLYEDLTPPPAKSRDEAASRSRPVAAREPGSGRPTKRERRQLSRLRDVEPGS